MAVLFQPDTGPRHLRAPTHRVRALDYNQLALQFAVIDSRQRRLVRLEWVSCLPQLYTTRGAARTPFARLSPNSSITILRISLCCLSMDLVASITWKPISSAMAWYSSRMRP